MIGKVAGEPIKHKLLKYLLDISQLEVRIRSGGNWDAMHFQYTSNNKDIIKYGPLGTLGEYYNQFVSDYLNGQQITKIDFLDFRYSHHEHASYHQQRKIIYILGSSHRLLFTLGYQMVQKVGCSPLLVSANIPSEYKSI